MSLRGQRTKQSRIYHHFSYKCTTGLILLLFTYFHSFSQTKYEQEVDSLRKKLQIKLEAKDYKSCYYLSNHLLNDKKYTRYLTSKDYYNAACVFAKYGKKTKAIKILGRAIIDKRFFDSDKIKNDTNLASLHSLPKWQDLVVQVINNNMLKTELENIYNTDQYYRYRVDSTIKKYGASSSQMQTLDSMIGIVDSINLEKIELIIKNYGWVSDRNLGEKASTSLWLVIQHADSSIQNKYLPIIRHAVNIGSEKPVHLAYLEDRILSEQGRPQEYGTQMNYDEKGNLVFYPIRDRQNVNRRRSKIGLGPIEEAARLRGVNN